MKYQSTTLILFAALATASSVDDELVNQVRRVLLVPNHHSTSRMLQLSDECVSATEAFAQDPTFFAIVQNAAYDCPEAVAMTEDSITLDYSVCPSFINEVTEACEAADGTNILIYY